MPILSGGPLYKDKTKPIEEYQSSLGETAAAAFNRAVDTGLSDVALGAAQMATFNFTEGAQNIGRTFGVDVAAEINPSNRVTAADARQQAAKRGVKLDIADDAYFSPGELGTVLALKERERKQKAVLDRRPQTWAGFGAEMGGGLAGSLVDPVQVAASFIPVVPAVRYAAWLERAGSAGGRALVRTGVGAAEGLVGSAVIEPFAYSRAQSLGLDYTAQDSFLNLAFGTVLGGGLHVTGGAIGDALSPARRAAAVAPEVKSREALAEAVTALDAGRALDVANVFEAYHGSPHSFSRFDMSRVGSGEGAAAFGHGLYFAEARDVAAEYAKDLGLSLSINGKPLTRNGKRAVGGGTTGNRWADDYLLLAGGDVDKALNNLADDYRGSSADAEYDAIKAALNDARGKVEIAQDGKIYKVAIKGSDENLYDWDKSLGEQSPTVRDAIDRVARDPRFALDKITYDMRGAEFSRFLQNPGVTAELKRLGVLGVKYLDQLSRQQGRGSRNYVIFDDAAVSVIAREPAIAPDSYDPATGYEPPEYEALRIEADRAMSSRDDIDGEIEALNEMLAMAEKREPLNEFDRAALDLADEFETTARRSGDTYRAAASCLSGLA
jgi:hypothetical protein